MSMYTQLLGAALGDRLPFESEPTRGAAVAEVRRCRHDLEAQMPGGPASDAVPSVLALQVGYDVALIELASVMGIESGPGHFEQPQRERKRLETALSDLGLDLDLRAGDGAHEQTVAF
jgi:hypothetical protein